MWLIRQDRLALRSEVMTRTNDRMRRRFHKRIAPDTRIEAVLAIKARKGPRTAKHASILGRYLQRYGLTNTLGSHHLFGDQWLVLTENRILLFAKRSGGVLAGIGALEHALDRTEVALQWADYTEARIRKRLIHLTTTDERMNVAWTRQSGFDEAELFVAAVGDRGREIGLQEL